MGNPVVHWELWSKTPDKTSAFYSSLFGWKLNPSPSPTYHMVDTQSPMGINGAIMTPQCEGTWPGNMSFYIAVDDLAEYRRKVAAAGAKIVLEEQAVPGMGAFSLFVDPDGRIVGLWKTLEGTSSPEGPCGE